MLFSPKDINLKEKKAFIGYTEQVALPDISAPWLPPAEQKRTEFSLECSYDGKMNTGQLKPNG